MQFSDVFCMICERNQSSDLPERLLSFFFSLVFVTLNVLLSRASQKPWDSTWSYWLCPYVSPQMVSCSSGEGGALDLLDLELETDPLP